MKNIKNIIKESLINEGEASKTPFRYRREKTTYNPKEKDSFVYEFKTKNGFLYNVILTRELGKQTYHTTPEGAFKEDIALFYQRNRAAYINLRNMGADRDDFKHIWVVIFSVEEAPEEFFVKRGETIGYPEGTEMPRYNTYIPTGGDVETGEFFKVMATISKIIKNHMKKYDGKILMFSPADERRGRVFSRYILTQMPGTRVFSRNDDFYFLLNV